MRHPESPACRNRPIRVRIAENEVRKDFTPSERVAIVKAFERTVGNRQGQRMDQLRVEIPRRGPRQTHP